MATVIQKQSCPRCGQSCNLRQETLSKNLVMALFRVVQWAQEKRIDRPIKRAEFAHLISGDEANTANFAKLAWFAPEFFKNNDWSGSKEPSFYEFNFDVINEFFACHAKIATVVTVDPLADPKHRYTRSEYRNFNQIPSLLKFLDENREYIVEYLVRQKYDATSVQRNLFTDRF